MTPQQFRKKPVIVEAMQLTEESFGDVVAWLKANGVDGDWLGRSKYGPAYIEIFTLEGAMWASEGDWIITGVAGEFYPCKPEIFAATYEPVLTPQEAWENRVQERVEKLTSEGDEG